MCGITGIMLPPQARDRARLEAIAAMTVSLAHRGPDGSGIWLDRDAGIALGHRRLAILDRSDAGRQPMISHDRRYLITFNGEVYSAPKLRIELLARGHRFHGHSDTEIMLAAIVEFGLERALDQFDGMFAFALWDRAERQLHLVRDRLGKKPLYIGQANGALLFGSELDALRAHPGFQARIDPDALAALLHQGWIPEEHCIWHGVFKLPPGSILSIGSAELQACDVGDMRARSRAWWSLTDLVRQGREDPIVEPSGSEAMLDGLLRTAVRERMVSDVPIGAFLSGGIDSSVVVALMQAQSAKPIRTFTIGFAESGYDEADDARAVAQHLCTDHTEHRVTSAEAQAVIPDLPGIWSEPFADASQIPTLLVAKLAREQVGVVLTGDGGDECFGGYRRHVMAHRLSSLFRVPAGLRRAAASSLTRLGPPAWNELLERPPFSWSRSLRGALQGETVHKFADVLDSANEKDLYHRLLQGGSQVHRPSSMRNWPEPADDAADMLRLLPSHGARAMFRDTIGYLPGDVLVKVDRATMALGLEARCPLLDHRILALAWRLPIGSKIRGGKGKWPLRQVLSCYLPRALFERPKQGFSVPVGAWLRGPLRSWAADILAPGRIGRGDHLNPEVVGRLWSEHLTGRRDHTRQLWAVLMFETWRDRLRLPGQSQLEWPGNQVLHQAPDFAAVE
ncbi:asparagine synthase (glutamine-hydrolyzing) [Geminicoccus roseus]|uniref:asparagine synthase (glutamine-hydrolyzing) n=1 Tax=Geminicoccus roseus TaxID=404900 RepID=UPI000413BEF5|nr:asparagine synthase (glutamine-hydrolyzing) [Geminicoccus roseus]